MSISTILVLECWVTAASSILLLRSAQQVWQHYKKHVSTQLWGEKKHDRRSSDGEVDRQMCARPILLYLFYQKAFRHIKYVQGYAPSKYCETGLDIGANTLHSINFGSPPTNTPFSSCMCALIALFSFNPAILSQSLCKSH